MKKKRDWFKLILYWTVGQIFRLLFRVRAEGLENVPESGALLCPNHADDLDPVLVGMCLPASYRLNVMAKSELFHNPLVGWFLGKLGAFPVNRDGTDVQAVKTAIKILRGGGNLLIFSEGTTVRNGVGYHDGLPAHAHSGAAMIAVRTGATLIPVFLGGKKRLFHPTRIIFGKPYAPTYSGRHGTSEELQKIADDVLKEAYLLGGQAVGGLPL